MSSPPHGPPPVAAEPPGASAEGSAATAAATPPASMSPASTTVAPTQPSSTPPSLLAALGAILLAALAFGPSVENGFVWDDVSLILRNDALADSARAWDLLTRPFWAYAAVDAEGISATYASLYRPVVMAWFLALHRLAGFEPLAWHAASIALHLLCVGLAAAWLARRFPERADADPRAAARRALALGVGLALFAVHPTRAEAVGWISGATETLAAACWLGALNVWPGVVRDDRGATARRLGAGLLFALALLAKESAVVAPALLLLDEALLAPPGTRGALAWGRRLRAVGVATAPAALVAAARFAAYPAPARPLATPSILLGHLAALGAYARHTVAPWPPQTDLVPIRRALGGADAVPQALVVLGAVVLLGVLALGVLAVRAPRWRGTAADAALWLVPLIPSLLVVSAGTSTLASERFLYLPLLGVGALATRALLAVDARAPRLSPWLVAAAGLALAAATLATRTSARRFESDLALARFDVASSPSDPVAWLKYGTALPPTEPDAIFDAFARGQRAAHARGADLDGATLLARTFARAAQDAPDHDDAGLRALRRFCEEIRAVGPVRFSHRGHTIDAAHPAIARAVLRATPADVGVPCAFLRLRTGDPAGALAEIGALERSFPERMEVQFAAVLIRALAGDLAGATAHLAEVEARGSRRFVTGDLAARLERARRTRADADVLAARDPTLAPLGEAQVALVLGSAGIARRALAPLSAVQPTRPEVALLGARIEQIDRRPALARVLIEDALADAPPPAAREALLQMRAALMEVVTEAAVDAR